MRKNPVFPFIQRWLPSLPESRHVPGWTSLSDLDLHEAAWLRLSEEDWKKITAPKLTGDGPVETGDDTVDAWEKALADGKDDFHSFGGAKK
jgi:hypothetical protein